jgi:hypothetical protein
MKEIFIVIDWNRDGRPFKAYSNRNKAQYFINKSGPQMDLSIRRISVDK